MANVISRDVYIAKEHYEFNIDATQRYLGIAILGSWNKQTAVSFGIDLEAAIRALVNRGAPFGSFRTLLDVRRSTIMAQELVGILQVYAEKFGPSSEHVSLLSGSVLQQMQYKRIAPQEMFRYYLDADRALGDLLTN